MKNVLRIFLTFVAGLIAGQSNAQATAGLEMSALYRELFWYERPWVWVAAACLILLLLMVALRNRERR